ncbi:MAG: YihY/virulence factor BrkB family protein [Actinobacteria bacterium]|nr:YihY/virulence factor BrkB family protein [Actinomycetota bacterium]
MAIKERLAGVPVLGTALRVQQRYTQDTADQYAASIGFFGFLSVFPLLLIAASIAGFVLRGDPAAQAELVRTAFDAIPGISAALGGGDGASQLDTIIEAMVENAGTIGLVGAVTLLLSGLRVVNAGMVATLKVFHVDAEVSGVTLKLRQLGALAVLGSLAVAGAVATAALGVAVRVDITSVGAVAASVATVAVSITLDLLLFLMAYRLLAVGRGPRFRRVWPGALLSAIAWTGLKAFGATYVSSQVAKANDLYGTLGGVIGLLILFYLAGRIYLYGAELSAVLHDPGTDLAARDDDVVYIGDSAGNVAEGTDPPAGTEEDDVDGPSPTARREPPALRVSPDTAARVARADDERTDHRADVRGALAFLLALGTIGGLLRFLKPWESDAHRS